MNLSVAAAPADTFLDRPLANSRTPTAIAPSARLDYLDATRAFALLLGVVFHASLSFSPYFMAWAVQDVSTSPCVNAFFTISHSFRMELFFLLAGFFGQVTFHRKGSVAFVLGRLLRLGVPFVLGWFVVRPLLVAGWMMGSANVRGPVDVAAVLRAGWQDMVQHLPHGMFVGSHLWFLYYLALITGAALVVRAAVYAGPWQRGVIRAADGTTAWIARSRLALPALVGPTVVALLAMAHWAVDTPSESLQLDWPVLAVYGGFFGLGWMFGRRRETIETFGRLSPDRWVLLAIGLAGAVILSPVEHDPANPHSAAARFGFCVCDAAMMWSLVSMTLAVSRRVFGQRRPWVRYVADSSYWMYLIHLPIVVFLQVAVADVNCSWMLKLLAISGSAIAFSLLTYDLLVRGTVIGRVLNGRVMQPLWQQWLARS